jgi:hypothetical protein
LSTTRTIGPLHFEDLEPKRFEDLVRQLVYEFRPWRKLEATGRGGADDGFDTRGWEIVAILDADRDDEPDDEPAAAEDRQWLIQCKRERVIGPKRLEEYAKDFRIDVDTALHGMIFAAACDFSKEAHDKFNAACRSLGVEEFYLWGKGELEDLLFQPRNDHLLFAYFGFSLTIRRRTLQASIRRDVAVKRRLKASVSKKGDYDKFVAIRNAGGDMYPELPPTDAQFAENHWRFCEFEQFDPRGLVVQTGRFFAFLDGEHWDAADSLAYCEPRVPTQGLLGFWQKDRELFESVRPIWNAFDDGNKAWLSLQWVIPYERILAIDDIGDAYFEGPHIYCTYVGGRPCIGAYASVEPRDRFAGSAMHPSAPDYNRTEKFPSHMRRAT